MEKNARVADAASRPLRQRSRWKLTWFNAIVASLGLAGMLLLMYPSAAAWVSQYNQSNILYDQTSANNRAAENELNAMFEEAHEYNSLLESGALYASGDNVAEGTGTADSAVEYSDLLAPGPTGTMARLRVPAIDLDLPVYHGTSDATLLKGVGHLEGTSLPVGGTGTRAVLTGHRGLANATMFTHLDRVEIGDSINVDVLGETFTYRVIEMKIVDPDDTEEIRPRPTEDLLTLVTCTPLGINSHRILLTGERVTPTPQSEIADGSARPSVPGFPWWLFAAAGGVALVAVYVWRSGLTPEKDVPEDPETV